MKFFWICCDKKAVCDSLDRAKNELESHEKESHKSKTIGSFGWEKESSNQDTQ